MLTRGAIVTISAVALLGLASSLVASEVEEKSEGPVISLFAGGVYGSAVWMVDIAKDGTASARVHGGRPPSKPVRQLTVAERGRLQSLVEALPTEKAAYQFGNGPIDAAMSFGLIVGTGKNARRYAISEVLSADDAGRPEVKHIVELLHFLHGLVGSKSALPPPTLKAKDEPK